MLGYTYPLLGLIVTMLIFAGVVLMVFFIVWCFIDNFRRHDHRGLSKVAWMLFILFVPIFGALVYVIARPADAEV